MTITAAYVGLGSNLGDGPASLERAVHTLRGLGTVDAVSPTHSTQPVGFSGQPIFSNAVCRLWTQQDPFELVADLLTIQRRVSGPRSFIMGPRALDLDLLIFGTWVLDTPGLVLPHPRMAEREFVLLPLADIVPGLVHPVLGETVLTLLDRVRSERVERYSLVDFGT
ncbi:MAG: 2-amino-4-hydroxy-6-hydroxymethyldihydropteridine diphosphokinase [SAR202 cluster bacterium]|nr:2-amino-4-hydroxy-6-hydroxymethyldihydropteridine diphosphokinase [SAR202 cluster bacterium]